MARWRARQGSRERRWGARGAAGAQSPARGVRAPRTMARGQGGDAGTVALAALDRRAGAVPALMPLPARSASAPSPGRSPGRVPGGARGSTQGAPARRAAAPTRSILPLQVWRRSPASDAPLLPGEPSRAGPVRSSGEADWTRGTCDPRREPPRRRPSGSELSPGTLSPAAGACVCEAVAPPARSSRLPSPPLPPLLPSTCTPPLGRTRRCAPPFPGEARLLTRTSALLLFFSPPAPTEPKLALL